VKIKNAARAVKFCFEILCSHSIDPRRQ
jgi:hypothetical protein